MTTLDKQALIVAAFELRAAEIERARVEQTIEEHKNAAEALQNDYDAARARVNTANARLMDLVIDRTHPCEGCGKVATNHRMFMYAGAIRYQCSECEAKAAALHTMLEEEGS